MLWRSDPAEVRIVSTGAGSVRMALSRHGCGDGVVHGTATVSGGRGCTGYCPPRPLKRHWSSRCAGRRRASNQARNGPGAGRVCPQGPVVAVVDGVAAPGHLRLLRQTIWTASGVEHEHGQANPDPSRRRQSPARATPARSLFVAVSSKTCVSPESAALRARTNSASSEATTGIDRPSSSGPVIATSSEREPIRYRLSGCEPFRPKAVLSQSIKPVLSREMVVLVLIAPLRVSMTESETDSRSRMHTAVFSCPLARAILFAHAWVASVSGTDTTSLKPDSANAIRSDETSVST